MAGTYTDTKKCVQTERETRANIHTLIYLSTHMHIAMEKASII